MLCHDTPVSIDPPIPPLRVSSVSYRIESDSETHDFSRVDALEGVLDGWSFRVEAGRLSANPSAIFGSREEAREDIEPRLAAWAQSAFLAMRWPFHFAYESADLEVIDPDPHNVFVFPESATLTASMGTPTVVIGHNLFPPPEVAFASTPLTDLLADRLRALEEGRAELPAIAYLVSTVIESSFGGRKGTQTTLAVSGSVLSNLNRLSSQFDPLIGRKASTPNPKPLTGEELGWMRAVIFRLTHRVGEQASGRPLKILTLADFPPLQ